LKTVTVAVPDVERSEAGMAAARRVGQTSVVGRLTPFHRTTEPPSKPEPSTMRVNPDPP